MWLQVYTTRPVAAGEELFISYGERSNTDFFVHYGFVPLRNPRDDVVLFSSIEDALDWYVLDSGLPCGLDRSDEDAFLLALQQIGVQSWLSGIFVGVSWLVWCVSCLLGPDARVAVYPRMWHTCSETRREKYWIFVLCDEQHAGKLSYPHMACVDCFLGL